MLIAIVGLVFAQNSKDTTKKVFEQPIQIKKPPINLEEKAPVRVEDIEKPVPTIQQPTKPVVPIGSPSAPAVVPPGLKRGAKILLRLNTTMGILNESFEVQEIYGTWVRAKVLESTWNRGGRGEIIVNEVWFNLAATEELAIVP
jgi:hypothetical protein